MEAAELELERRSKFLNSLIVKKKAEERQEQTDGLNVRVRAADMPYALQSRAFRCARDHLTSTPGKLDSKRLALTLKKEFDSSYGPAWHCIVGTSFGSYVTHSLGGFLYFSIDKRPNRGRYLHLALHMAKGSEAETIGESAEARPLHDALFLVLSYLPVFELLSVAQVCRPLREAVNTDVLPWLDFLVERPLSSRLTDKFLKNITSRSKGRVRVLGLIDCDKITDDGLRQVLDDNPLVDKLWIPGCTSLTPEGVVEAVKKLSLKSLIINGVYNIKKHHVEALQSHFQQNSSHHGQQPHLHYHSPINFQTLIKSVDLPSIDVEICPRCNEITRVYGCPKKICRRGRNCRACIYCIPRCEECGGCVEEEEEDVETACSDTLCSDCWLTLPKCSFCNKPYCKRHACSLSSEEPEFLCSSCHERFVENFNHHMQ